MPSEPLTPDENAALRRLLAERQAWGIIWKIAMVFGAAAVGLATMWGNFYGNNR